MKRHEIVDYLIEKNFSIQSNLCIFCSVTTDGWNRFCPSCKDYKGMMNIVDAIEKYDLKVLGAQARKRPGADVRFATFGYDVYHTEIYDSFTYEVVFFAGLW